MKKFLLSGLVLGVFFLYGLHQRDEAANVQVIAPTQLQPSPTDIPAAPTTSSAATPPPSSAPTQTLPTATPIPRGKYKDGTYTGSPADAFYGNIQVQAVISGGKITGVNFLQYPNDRGTSIMINQQAMPYLRQEAIAAQSANVDIVSGATDSSMAFRQSLQSALNQAI